MFYLRFRLVLPYNEVNDKGVTGSLSAITPPTRQYSGVILISETYGGFFEFSIGLFFYPEIYL